MFKFVAILALAAVAVAKPGVLTHSVVEPVVVGHSVHSAPSAISHQSQTQYHSKTIVTPVVAPVVKSVAHAAPVVHAAPLLHTAEVLHAAPVLSHVHHAVHTAPVLHSASVLHAAPILNAPLVHSVYSAPLLHH